MKKEWIIKLLLLFTCFLAIRYFYGFEVAVLFAIADLSIGDIRFHRLKEKENDIYG